MFHLLLGFTENQIIFWDFKIQNSVWITKGSDNGDSDTRVSTVLDIINISRLKSYICRIRNGEG